MNRPPWRWVLLLALAFAAARGALHVATFALPLSNDDAIPMIQAALVLRGEASTTLINQPYNGTLDSWLMAAPLSLAPPHAVFRLYELLCGALLVALCAWLAARAGGPIAGRAAALLAAFGTPYMALMTAVGPVPNFMIPILVGLVLALLWPGRGDAGPGRALAAGLAGGLAVWDSALAVPALAGALGGLALSRSRRVGLRPVAGFAVGLVLGYLPALVARAIGAAGSSNVTALRPPHLWPAGVAGLLEAAAALFGATVALVVDGPERAPLPTPVSAGLVVALAALVSLGIRRESWPLAGWAMALAGAFAFSRRTGPHEVRYLYGLTVPVLVMAALGFERLYRLRTAAAYAAVVPLVAAWGLGHATVWRHWRDPRHAAEIWQVPPLGPALVRLERAGSRSAYASLQFAGRLVVESGWKVIASQAWNERIPGDPLRFRDEVDLDPRAAWVLSPRWSRGMPRVPGFRALLQDMGGTWREDGAEDVVIFHAFEPPFDERRAVPGSEIDVAESSGGLLPAAVLDRDTATVWRAPLGLSPGAGLVVRVTPPRRLSALVLAVDLDSSPLGVPWAATLGGEIVARGPRRYGLQWMGGVPRAGKQALLTIVLPEREADEVRLLFQGAGPPLAVSEVFVYGPDEPAPPEAGQAVAARAFEAARAGRWPESVALYAEAVRAEPDRASYHASLVRARRRAAGRQSLDVESLDDGAREILNLGR